jgi:hypothetical protein
VTAKLSSGSLKVSLWFWDLVLRLRVTDALRVGY